ncbi:MAG: type II secretion system F family protein [Porphyrobacter sp.]|nr:type II secretion system F family protein [Porphyrobacter sp.]
MLTPELTRILSLLTVFASVVLGAYVLLRITAGKQAHVRTVNKRIAMIASGTNREDVYNILRRNDWLRAEQSSGFLGKLLLSVRRQVIVSGLDISFERMWLGIGIAFVVLLLLIILAAVSGGFALGPGIWMIAILSSLALSIGIPLSVISAIAERQRKKLQNQFPQALDVFVRSLRAGHPVTGALELLTREMEDPIGSEFGLVSDEISYGADLRQAIHDMAERWDNEDLRIFVVTLSIQSDTGGNLAEVLDNLAGVIRERASLLLKVRALSSEGRMTGIMLTVLPLLALGSILLTSPGFYFDVADDPIFYIGFPLTFIWYLFGLAMIRAMVNVKV